MVMLADGDQEVRIVRLSVGEVMNVKRSGARPQPIEDALTVARNNLFADLVPAGVVVDPGRHLVSRR